MIFDRRYWRLAARLGLVLCLSVVASLLLEHTHFYATSLTVVLLAIALSAQLLQRVHPGVAAASLPTSNGAPVEHLQAQLDTVSAALIEVSEDGRTTLVNRAAHRLGRGPVARLGDIEVLGAECATRIAALAPGQSDMLRLPDGRYVFVSAGELATVQSRRRLVAIQFVSGELDVVEIKAWRDMLRVVRHEIMNSLTPIVSLSESLATTPPGPDTTESLEAIGRRSRGLLQFVDRYRRVLEPLQPSAETVSGALLVKAIEQLWAADLAAAGVIASFGVDEPAPTFLGDASLLEQAIINLLKNALDAVRETTSPRIDLRLTESHGEVRFQVSDNGSGIAPERCEQIFLPFYSTKKAGSGLGLSIARNIALAHGGRVTYQPNEPVGSVFQLIIRQRARTHANI